MVSTEGLVGVHLLEHDGWGADEAPQAVTTAGIAAALGVGDALSDRVDLLSTLSAMADDGLVRSRETAVVGESGEHTGYELTDEGRALAAAVGEELADLSVTVRVDGDRERVSLPAAAERLDDTGLVELGRRVGIEGVDEIAETPREDVVDRSAPTATLRDALGAVADGAARTVLLTGGAGIGKTTLVEYARERADEREMVVLAGGGRGDAGGPYGAVRSALDDRRERFVALFEGTGTDLDPGDDARERRLSLFYDIETALRELADETPVLLVVDDLHDADEESRAMLAHLAEALAESPICLLGAARTGDRTDGEAPVPDGLSAAADERIDLGPLDRAATGELVERVLDDTAVPASFVDAIHDHTGGTPLFVEESVAALRADGVIDPAYGHYPDDATLPVPDRVEAVVERRVAALEGPVREVLEYGAVVGSPIPLSVLSVAVDRAESTLRECVDVLADGTIWHRVDGGSVAFETDIVREVVLDGIDDDRERALRRTVAEAFLDVYGTETPSQSGRIARQFAAAGAPERAMDHAMRAGDHALEVYAHEMALEHFETALVLARRADDEASVLDAVERIGRVHATRGEYEEADRRYDYVLERTDDRDLRRRIARQRVSMRINQGEYEACIDVARDVLSEWDGETADPTVCRLLGAEGWARQITGDPDRARELFERSLAMARELDDDDLRARALHRLGTLENFLGDVETAIDLLESATDVAAASDLIERESSSVNNLAMIHLKRGDLSTARDQYARSRELARVVGDRVGEVLTVGNLGYVEQQMGNWDQTVEYARECLSMAESLDIRASVSIGHRLLGVVAGYRGEFDEARSRLRESLDIEREMQHMRFVALVHAELARIDRVTGDLDAALDHAREARTAALDVDRQWEARANAELGAIYLRRGHLPAARACYERGLEQAAEAQNSEVRILNRLGVAAVALAAGESVAAHDAAATALGAACGTQMPLLVVRAQTVYGRCLLARGAPAVAERVLRDARVRADSLGAVVELARVERALGESLAAQGAGARGDALADRALDRAADIGAGSMTAACEPSPERSTGTD